MREYVKKNKKEILLTVVTVLFASLICCSLILVQSYSDGLDRQARDASKLKSKECVQTLDDALDYFVDSAENIASNIPQKKVDANAYLQSVKTEDEEKNGYISSIRTVSNGEIYDINNANEPVSDLVLDYENFVSGAMEKNVIAVSKLIYDGITTRGFLVFVPVSGEKEVSAILLFYKIGALESRLKYDTSAEVSPQFVGICNDGGEIFHALHKGAFDLNKNDNLFEKMRKLTNDKSSVDEMVRGIKNNAAVSISVGGEKYVLSIDCSAQAGSNIYAVTVYKNSEIYSEGYQLVGAVYSIIVILFIIVVCLIIYMMVARFRDMHKEDEIGTVDKLLECPTFKKFAIQTNDYLIRNKITRFAVAYIKIQHYEYIEEHFGKDLAEESLKFLVKIFSKSLVNNETFCRYGDSDFLLLMHFREKNEVISRLKVINVLAYNCPKLVEKGYGLKLSMGVYYIDREQSVPIQKMVDFAVMAERAKEATQISNIHVYEQRLHDMFLHEAEIESKMEGAIANNEFKVFFQPKYSIAQDKTGGAEALVRWFDPENKKFRQPAEFIPLFETNGFITTMDKYIFVEVCKYFKQATERGDKIVPISVNVSRVTAIQPDFLDFYISNKRKYGVADNFLMIEFTENFAYENYQTLKTLVFALHENGFKCSIDDFGSGYSSFNILKELPMDELKLDKFFIQSGVSKERDEILLKTVVELAKKMGMIVTQEGVETESQVKRLKKLGCDLIQGYVYSKPLNITDFESFIKDGKMHGI